MPTKLNKLLLEKHKSYAIINPRDFATETELLNKVAEILNSGIDTLELRTQNINSSVLIGIATKIRELTAVFEALFIIYDRIDIAKLTRADGISLDKNTIDIKNAKKLTEDTMLMGIYCNSESEINEAYKNADFIITNCDTTSDNIKAFKIQKEQ